MKKYGNLFFTLSSNILWDNLFLVFSEELDMMLQRRAGSGDGGELIDRVSLTSSISFIQSQTFPDSIFSQSFGRYCMNV